MSYQDFFTAVNDYYGGYPESSKAPVYIKKYLSREIEEEKVMRLFDFVTKTHPIRFGPPDIAACEKAIFEALKNHWGESPKKSKKSEYVAPKELTKEERETMDKILEESGGLSALIKKV